jgi:hypothetical protein
MAEAYQVLWGGIDAVGAFAMNAFHFDVAETPGADPFTVAGDLADALYAQALGSYSGIIAQDCTINFRAAKKLSGLGGPTNTRISSDPGLDPFDQLTNAFAADIAIHPGGALNRVGHIFTWGLSTNSIDAGLWTMAFKGLVNTFMGDLFTTLTAASFTTAKYGTYTRKTKTVTPAMSFELKPKPTGMNKRTLPVT